MQPCVKAIAAAATALVNMPLGVAAVSTSIRLGPLLENAAASASSSSAAPSTRRPGIPYPAARAMSSLEPRPYPATESAAGTTSANFTVSAN